MARHPKLRVIGCHIGSSEEDLSAAAKRLDAYPNFAVDLASRVRFLARQPREDVRQFMMKYADRVLYATDFQPGTGNEEAIAKSFVASHELEWNYFSSGCGGRQFSSEIIQDPEKSKDRARRRKPGE